MTTGNQEDVPAGKGGCLIIVCGLPGSGKTTTAKELARQRRAVRLGPDEWMTALGADLWDTSMRKRVESLQWSVAEDLLQIGATVVVEWGTWGRDERDALRVRARELGVSESFDTLMCRPMNCGVASKCAKWSTPHQAIPPR